MKPEKIASYIGFAMKAGRIVSGEFAVERALRNKRARLVVFAEDVSRATEEKIRKKCSYYGVPVLAYKTKNELGRIIGKEQRACLAVNDESFSNIISEAIMSENNPGRV